MMQGRVGGDAHRCDIQLIGLSGLSVQLMSVLRSRIKDEPFGIDQAEQNGPEHE